MMRLLSLAILFFHIACANALTLKCAQQSRFMCEQGKGCRPLVDLAPNQWKFVFEPMTQGSISAATAARCSGGTCSSPFKFVVRGVRDGQELVGWESVSNETFAFSASRREFSHSLTGSHSDGGHIVSEFGFCSNE
jgi:hypothetical protein